MKSCQPVQAVRYQQEDAARLSSLTRQSLTHLNSRVLASQLGAESESAGAVGAELCILQEAVHVVAHVAHAVAINQLDIPEAHIQLPTGFLPPATLTQQALNPTRGTEVQQAGMSDITAGNVSAEPSSAGDIIVTPAEEIQRGSIREEALYSAGRVPSVNRTEVGLNSAVGPSFKRSASDLPITLVQPTATEREMAVVGSIQTPANAAQMLGESISDCEVSPPAGELPTSGSRVLGTNLYKA